MYQAGSSANPSLLSSTGIITGRTLMFSPACWAAAIDGANAIASTTKVSTNLIADLPSPPIGNSAF